MRVVLDTNIWISGLLQPESTAAHVLASWKENSLIVVTSQPILDEIKTVLNYSKIQKRLHWDEGKIDQFILLLTFFTDCVTLPKDSDNIGVVRDIKDTPILDTLLISKADYLVTGDKDLLSLKEDYSIITLADFHKFIL